MPEVPVPAQPAVHAPAAPAAATYPDLVPSSREDEVRVTREAGSSWNISGGGYTPGAAVHVMFGPYQTDRSLIGDAVAYADANGCYSMRITLSADLAPGTYGVMTRPEPLSEEGKRFAIVDVVAPS